MKDECIAELARIAGRSLSDTALTDIENRIARNRRQLAITDREAYLKMTPDEQVTAAAKMAVEQRAAEAAKDRSRLAAMVVAHDRFDKFATDQLANHGHDRLESLRRWLVNDTDNKSNVTSVEGHQDSIKAQYTAELVSNFELTAPKLFGLFTNKQGIQAFSYALYGEGSRIVDGEVRQLAEQAAKVWKDTAEAMRQRFNAAGGIIGKLDNWLLPQRHTLSKVLRAGLPNTATDAERQAKWSNDTLPLLDRRKYANEDGTLMNDKQMLALLHGIWDTITTGGINSSKPGKIRGKATTASRHSESRSLHFKDADSDMKYREMYSDTDLYSMMHHHLGSLGRDIGLLETGNGIAGMGPNADAFFKYQLERGYKEAVEADRDKEDAAQKKMRRLQSKYGILAGKGEPVESQFWMKTTDGFRHMMSAIHLGFGPVSMMGDRATMRITKDAIGIPEMRYFKANLAAFNPANAVEKRMAQRAGLGLGQWTNEVNQMGADLFGAGFARKASNLTWSITGASRLEGANRRALGSAIYGALGDSIKTAEHLGEVGERSRAMLESKGVTETDWQVWRKAEPYLEDWGNGNDGILTKHALEQIPDEGLAQLGDPTAVRREAILKLIHTALFETNLGIPIPGVNERAVMSTGVRGTPTDVLAKTFFLFKSFPLTMFTKHWNRGWNGNTTGFGRAVYLSKLIAYTTIVGAVQTQISALMRSEDPHDMTNARFWLAAFLKGGSLGMYGDFLFNDYTQGGNTPWSSLAGPGATFAEDALGTALINAQKAIAGKPTNFGADSVKFLKKDLTPNWWFTKAAMDHMIFNNMQDFFSPGYSARQAARAQQNFGTTSYWGPTDALPNRAPDFSKAVGQ